MFSHVTLGTNDFDAARSFYEPAMATLRIGQLFTLPEILVFGDAFHAVALENGGTDDGAPGLRPRCHLHHHGAYVRDPAGNKLQAVCQTPESSPDTLDESRQYFTRPPAGPFV